MTDMPEPTRYGQAIWLEPFPDVLLEGIPDRPRTRRREAPASSFARAAGAGTPAGMLTIALFNDIT